MPIFPFIKPSLTFTLDRHITRELIVSLIVRCGKPSVLLGSIGMVARQGAFEHKLQVLFIHHARLEYKFFVSLSTLQSFCYYKN